MVSKHILLIKFGQFLSYYERKKFIQKFYKICYLKSSRPFLFSKNLVKPLFENKIFEATYLYQISISKTIKTCLNHHTDFLKFRFAEDYLKIKKRLEIVSRSHFSQNFFIKKFLLKYYINQPKFIPKLFISMSEKLKFHYLKNEKSF